MVNRRPAAAKSPIRMGETRDRGQRMGGDHGSPEISLAKVQVNRKRRQAQGGTGHVHPNVGSPIDEPEVDCQDGRRDEGRAASRRKDAG